MATAQDKAGGTLGYLDGRLDASYDVLNIQPIGIMTTLNQVVQQLQARRRQSEQELEKLNQAIRALTSLGGTSEPSGQGGKKKYKMSRKGRLAIARAKTAWWAKKKAAQKK